MLSNLFFTFQLQIIFLETLCNDQRIIERNIRLKIQQSPDYAEEYEFSNHLFRSFLKYSVFFGGGIQ